MAATSAHHHQPSSFCCHTLRVVSWCPSKIHESFLNGMKAHIKRSSGETPCHFHHSCQAPSLNWKPSTQWIFRFLDLRSSGLQKYEEAISVVYKPSTTIFGIWLQWPEDWDTAGLALATGSRARQGSVKELCFREQTFKTEDEKWRRPDASGESQHKTALLRY